MTVPYAFANLSGNIALAKLDSNFNTPITIGNTSVLLGNTVTTLNNLTLANVTITSGTSNVTNVNVTNVTVTNLTATLANVTTLNVASAFITSANIGTLALTNALPVSSGGTGQVTFPANSVLLGNGTGGIATVAPGNVGNVLTSIGGVWVSNVAVSGAAAGANTQVQYNSSNALAGSANLTFNGTTLTANTLNLTNALGTTYGGTGLTSFTANGVVYASSTSALTTGSALVFNGTNLGLGVTPSAFDGKAFQFNTTGVLYSPAARYSNFGSNFNESSGVASYLTNGNATLYSQNRNAGVHAWYNAPSGTAGNAITFTQAMTLDASGNLVIGDTSASYRLDVKGSTGNGIAYRDGTVINYLGTTGSNLGYLGTLTNHPVAFLTNATERARIDSSGNLLVGTTSSSGAGAGTVLLSNGASLFTRNNVNYVHYISNLTTSGGAGFITFQYGTSQTEIGSITTAAGTVTLYNTTSDQRLKENIQDAESASDLIDAIQVRQFDWKSDGSHQRYGFVAQELVAVAPEAVYQPQDQDKMMAVDYSKLVPMLVKEIQSLRIRIAQLEAK
jgi:hypothetical protein